MRHGPCLFPTNECGDLGDALTILTIRRLPQATRVEVRDLAKNRYNRYHVPYCLLLDGRRHQLPRCPAGRAYFTASSPDQRRTSSVNAAPSGGRHSTSGSLRNHVS